MLIYAILLKCISVVDIRNGCDETNKSRHKK